MNFDDVFKAFLSKLTEDEWVDWDWADVEKDLLTLLDAAIAWFKFPNPPITYDSEGFDRILDNQEIQILSTYMKVEWYNRQIMSWENIKPLYLERDFSQANLLSKFQEQLKLEEQKARKLEANYYRSQGQTPFDFKKLAGRR